jgi:uncharacterized membrane protein
MLYNPPARDANPAQSRAGQLFQPLALAAFLFSATACLAVIFQIPGFADASWPPFLFVFLALVVTLTDLAQSLPLQNVAAIAAFTVIISVVAGIVGVQAGIPFGPRVFTGDLGPEILGLPWAMPAICTVAILSSRGVARLILRPGRKRSTYGLWVITIACALTVLLDFALEPFASAHSFWPWQSPSRVHDWPGAPWINFIAWGFLTVLILVLITPWFINKQPGAQPPLSFHPLIVWLLLNLLPTADTAAHHVWVAPTLTLLGATIVAIYAIRGSRW